MTKHLAPVRSSPPTVAEMALRDAIDRVARLEHEVSEVRDALTRAHLALAATPATAQPSLAYSVPRAAALLGISRSTLYELIKAGRLRTVHLGGTKVLAADLDEYVTTLRGAAS